MFFDLKLFTFSKTLSVFAEEDLKKYVLPRTSTFSEEINQKNQYKSMKVLKIFTVIKGFIVFLLTKKAVNRVNSVCRQNFAIFLPG
jgi:hypothetical protein